MSERRTGYTCTGSTNIQPYKYTAEHPHKYTAEHAYKYTAEHAYKYTAEHPYIYTAELQIYSRAPVQIYSRARVQICSRAPVQIHSRALIQIYGVHTYLHARNVWASPPHQLRRVLVVRRLQRAAGPRGRVSAGVGVFVRVIGCIFVRCIFV